MLHTYACKTLKPGLAKYAGYADLFRIGSTEPKKIFPDLICCLVGSEGPKKKCTFFEKCSNIFEQIFFSKVLKFTWKMRNRLNQKENKISGFLFYVFRSFLWCDHSNFWWIFITQKIKIGKICNFIFIFIQPIPDISCKFEHFWKKNLFDNVRTFLNKHFFPIFFLFLFKRVQIYMKYPESAE